MGACCPAGRRTAPEHSASCDGHHSLYIHPEPAVSHTKFNVVYRPPQLNQRLAPGAAKPRFWISPTNETAQCPAVVSVAWCEVCQPKAINLSRLTNTRRPLKRHSAKVGMAPESGVAVTTTAETGDAEEDSTSRLAIDDVLMAGDSEHLVVRAYPAFLIAFVNQVLRLRLVFPDQKLEQLIGENSHLSHNEEEQGPMLETSYLIRWMHSIRLHLGYSKTMPGLPEVTVEENHGGIKRRKKVRYRPMPVRWIDLDHRKPSLTIVGESFQLTLARPCPALTPEDFPDGNGETPAALGTYMRTLDSCSDRKLQFSARLYHWYNQLAPAECYSETSPKSPDLEDSYLDLL